MPISLLLEETTLAFRFGAKKLCPWTHLVEVEELLIDRARSAFLVRWFGPGLPLRGAYLRAVLARENLIALRNQYLLAKASVEEELSGPNLTEPLAGLAGEVIGFLLTDGPLLLFVGLMRKTGGALAMVAKILVAFASVFLGAALGAAGTGLVVGLGLPAGLLGGLYLGATKDEHARALVEMLGAAAGALDASRIFIAQLLGPRENVRNPLVRLLLDLFDHLAGLIPQMLGLVAFVVVEIGPLLTPLAAELVAFSGLVGASVKALSFIFGDLVDKLSGLFEEKTSPLYGLKVVFKHLLSLLARLLPPIKALVANTKVFFAGAHGDKGKVIKAGLGDRLEPAFKAFFDGVSKKVRAAIAHSPTVVQIDAAKIAVAAATPTFDSMMAFITAKVSAFASKIPFAGGSSTPAVPFPKLPSIGAKDLPSKADVFAILGGQPALDFSLILPIAKDQRMFHDWLFGPPLSKDAQKALERVRHPASVFAGEQKALAKTLTMSPMQALEAELTIQESLGDLLADVVGRVLPPQMRIYIDKVIGGFTSLHDGLSLDEKKGKTGKAPAKPDAFDFPTRDFDDNGMLYPVIHRLTIKTRGMNKPAVEAFEERLQRRLLAQSFPAPQGA